MIFELLLVGTGGFLGSITRYLIYLWFGAREWISFPWATLVINVLGCLLVGMIGSLVERSVPYHRHILLMGSVGFLGAFTTFSAFGFETVNLLKNQQILLAFANVLANLCLGLVAVLLGRSWV